MPDLQGNTVIVIDPGHGGENLGAQVDGYTEKEMTMIVASTKNKYCPTAMRAWKIRFILFCFCC